MKYKSFENTKLHKKKFYVKTFREKIIFFYSPEDLYAKTQDTDEKKS